MKKTVFITIIALSTIFHLTVMGQNNRFELGIEGGPGITTIYGNEMPAENWEFIAGGEAGVFFKYNFSKVFSLKTQLAWERKGMKFILKNEFFDMAYSAHFDYLTVPLLIQAGFGGEVHPYINAGPYFSYSINRKYIAKNGESITSDMESDKKIDFGIVGGIGIDITLTKLFSMTVDLYDHYGLYNTENQLLFTDSVGVPVNSDKSTYNHSLFLTIGFAYCLAQ